MSTFKRAPALRGFARPAALASVLGALSACQIKDSGFFEPPATQTEIPIPVEMPRFIGELPAATLGTGPFAINTTSITLVPVAGVAASQVTATANGQTVPVSVSGNTVIASLAGKPDGLYTLKYSLSYGRGLLTAQYDYQIKNTPPVINIPTLPTASSPTAGASVPLSLNGSINDGSLYVALGAIYKPGSSNTCGNTDNTLWPQGTGAGQVSGNQWNYTNSVRSSGSFGFNVSAFNPVAAGGQQTMLRYCFFVTAEDSAKDATGAPKHNVASRSFPIDQTWLAPVVAGFTLTASATYRHLGNESEVCVTVNTTPPQADASAQISISGPGLLSPSPATTTLGSSGSNLVRFRINQFGTYSGTVSVTTSAGTRTATFSVPVTSSAGTCT